MKKYLLIAILSTLFTIACVVPSWVNTVEADVETFSPIALEIVAIADPALSPVAILVSNALTVLDKALKQYQASPTATNLQAVQSALNVTNSNVAQFETAIGKGNTATDAKINAAVAIIAQGMAEITAQIPSSSTSVTLAKSKVKLHNAKYFKSQFNKTIKGDSRFKPLN